MGDPGRGGLGSALGQFVNHRGQGELAPLAGAGGARLLLG